MIATRTLLMLALLLTACDRASSIEIDIPTGFLTAERSHLDTWHRICHFNNDDFVRDVAVMKTYFRDFGPESLRCVLDYKLKTHRTDYIQITANMTGEDAEDRFDQWVVELVDPLLDPWAWKYVRRAYQRERSDYFTVGVLMFNGNTLRGRDGRVNFDLNVTTNYSIVAPPPAAARESPPP